MPACYLVQALGRYSAIQLMRFILAKKRSLVILQKFGLWFHRVCIITSDTANIILCLPSGYLMNIRMQGHDSE